MRVGALTVGLGAAVTVGQAVATADPADTTDSTQSASATGTVATDTNTGETATTGSSAPSSTSTSSTSPTSTVSAQQNTGETTAAGTNTDKKSDTGESSAENTATPTQLSSSATQKTPVDAVDTTTVHKSDSAHEATSPDSKPLSQTTHEETATDVSAQTLSVKSPAAATVSVATPTTVSVAVPSTTLAAARPAVQPVASQAPVTVSSMIADVLTWMGWGGQLTNGLRLPGDPVPDLIAGLWLVVRQAAYSLNNQRPVTNTTVSGPGPDGILTGSLNATDYDDATLTYAVTRAPAHGSLAVDTLGNFTYTPDAQWAAVGGTDSFTITVDDTVGNPLHIHGLLDLFGQVAPTAATVSVAISPIGSDAATVARAHYLIDGAVTAKTIATKADAADLLNGMATALGASTGFASPDNITVQTVGTAAGDVPETFYRVHETVSGIPVLGSDVVLVTNAVGTVTALFNNHDGRIAGTDTTPDARFDTSDEAVAAAAAAYLASTTGQTDRAAVAALMSSSTFKPDLVVYALDSGSAPRLAWRVVIDPPDVGAAAADAGDTYFIYANGAEAGRVIADTSNVQALAATTTARDVLGQTRQINIDDTTVWFFWHVSALSDTVRNLQTYWTSYQFWGWGAPVLPGTLVNQGWFGWDAAGVSAHANETATYDYYANVLGLKSFDGNGARIDVNINYNPHATFTDYFSGYNNAFWDPTNQQFAFGNGGDLEAALDIVAHEYTHAVVSHAVGNGGSVLDYGEPGALNEALRTSWAVWWKARPARDVG